jgi:hypothetical protein
MAPIDLSTLSPAGAAIAMRTWPRRYRAALAPLDDDRIEERAHQLGLDGGDAVDVATDSVRTWAILERALHEIRFSKAPVLHPAVTEPSARRWDAPAHDPLESVLEQISDGASSMADAIEATPVEDWGRTAPSAGGGEISALDVAREAVRVGTENLRRIEQTLAALD